MKKPRKRNEERVEGDVMPPRLDRAPRKSGGGNWIAGAIKHPGAPTKSAKIADMTPKAFADMTPKAFAEKHKGDSGKTGKRARLALTLGKLKKG